MFKGNLVKYICIFDFERKKVRGFIGAVGITKKNSKILKKTPYKRVAQKRFREIYDFPGGFGLQLLLSPPPSYRNYF